MLKSVKRNLAAESLENRQLLHGGGIGEASVADRVEGVFGRYDANEDGVLNADDELSERVTERLAEVDGDADGSVTVAELTTYYETNIVSRLLGVGDATGRRGLGASVEDRIARAIEVVDDDGEGDIDQAEVSESLWTSLAEADLDGDLSLSAEELTPFVETIDAARMAARIANRVDAIFERYAGEESSESIVESEVSERLWSRLSEADADEDGEVTKDELTAHLTEAAEARAEERAEREAEESDDDEGDRGRRNSIRRIVSRFRGRGGRG